MKGLCKEALSAFSMVNPDGHFVELCLEKVICNSPPFPAERWQKACWRFYNTNGNNP